MTPATQARTRPTTQPTGAFLRWVGGKRKLVPQLLARVPAHTHYIEPFLGAGSLFFALSQKAQKAPIPALIADLNWELIETYQALGSQPEAVIRTLQACVARLRDADCTVPVLYEEMRSMTPQGLPPAAIAARFIVLNKLCFNGIYRVNKKGTFNVPLGKFTTFPNLCDVVQLRHTANVLQTSRAEILHQSFEESLEAADRGSFVYCDPPYAPVSATADFTSYTKEAFDDAAQTRLRDCLIKARERGAHVLVSNSNAPLIHKLYDTASWHIEKIQVGRAVNSDINKRQPVTELFIAGDPI